MPGVEKRSVSLSSELAAEIDQAVASGQYGNASEVVREALREWKERRDLFGYSLEELRQLVQEGIESGPPIDAEVVFANLKNASIGNVCDGRLEAQGQARGRRRPRGYHRLYRG